MFVTYTPEGGNEPQSWEFNPGRVRVSEQVIVEKQFGGTWAEFVLGCKVQRAEARRVLLWHLIRRTHPALSFKDTPDFYDDELVIEQSLAELVETYDEWVKSGGPAGENGALLDGMFLAEIESARQRGDEAPGKAPSKNEPADTPGR